MKTIFASFLILTACSSSNNKKSTMPQCYLLHGNPVVQISSEQSRVYLFGKFIDQEFFYYEERNYLNAKYLPADCKPDVVARAKFLLDRDANE